MKIKAICENLSKGRFISKKIQTTMNYKEKVAKQIHDFVKEMEENLTKLVTDFVIESFKNGVETGKQEKNKTLKTNARERGDDVEEGS